MVAENEAGQDAFTPAVADLPGSARKRPLRERPRSPADQRPLLPDCRAYELVSAANAGGYEVESTLVPGQTPYAGYPNAQDSVLYSLHFGSLPGIAGEPPNFGRDPYVAERGDEGWVSHYVGLPGAGMADPEPYGSPVLAADDQLKDFAFGGEESAIPASPASAPTCRCGSTAARRSRAWPARRTPGASAPEPTVAKYLSADGSHLVFGSKKEFEADGAGETARIYERDLKAGVTQIVSTDEAGNTLAGGGVAELDLSSDGSRVLVGKKVSTDRRRHLLPALHARRQRRSHRETHAGRGRWRRSSTG